MDFWSRLLSHTPLSAGNLKRDITKDPVRRRHRFEKEYSQLLQTWRNSSNLIHDINAADTIELRIQELNDLLTDESRRPLPHTCLNFASEKQIYVPIGKIAATSYNLYIIKEAVYFFGTLIESEDETVLENEAFASSLTNLLVRITGVNSIRLDLETETKVVELAFNITTKVRLRPEMLPAWFKPGQRHYQVDKQQQDSPVVSRRRESDTHERFEGKTQRQDFPLFYILIDYIHSEGKIGDFARTGLLYIIESASSSAALEQWIVESDLSTLMATGLGALYSQLSRKLVIDHSPGELPPILALSDYEAPIATFEIVGSSSPEFQVQLDTFLSHLLFWQDVLQHCRSVEVKSTLLEHFQVIFLQQLLYPSLLESSDIDGGSSVAVLTYLRRILESLDHPDMINLILHYLLALPDVSSNEPSAEKSAVSAARKRKSMDLATLMAEKAEATATPLLFNLVDLILACLKSHSQQTINVTLQLVSVILRRHHRYAITTLLRIEPATGVKAKRTVGAHQQDLEFFMSNAGVIGGGDNFDEIYENVLRDTVVRLESHPCSLKLIAPKISTNNHELPAIPDSLPGAPQDVPPHSIRSDDPLLSTILDRLETFFINSVDTNLCVTDAVLDLATCGFVAVEGWLLRHPDNYEFDSESGSTGPVKFRPDAEPIAGVDNPASLSIWDFRKRPAWSGLTRLLSVLQTLSDQVAYYRRTIPRFDDLLQQRREAFQTADSAATSVQYPQQKKHASNNPTTPGIDRTSLDNSSHGSPARPSVLEGFAQRILSELTSSSRSASPRGKKDLAWGPNITSNSVGAGFGVSANGNGFVSNGYGTGTPTSTKPIPIAPKEFPLNPDGISTRSYSPNSQPEEIQSLDGRSSTITSQLVAFQAVDRQILARSVGLMSTQKTIEGRHLGLDKQPFAGKVIDGSDSSDAEYSAVVDAAALRPQTNTPSVDDGEKTVTVSHILTNTIVLQSFLIEIAALLQVRAGLFDEVRFA